MSKQDRPAAGTPRWRRRPVLIVAALVVVLAGVRVAMWSLDRGAEPLPAPPVRAHDPVPAGPIAKVAPDACGVTSDTLGVLVPDAQVDRAGADGRCTWSARGTHDRGGRGLRVALSIAHAGGTGPHGSPMAATITRYREAAHSLDPVSGLGDEAAFDEPSSDLPGPRRVVFRAGNVVATVAYSAADRTRSYKRDRSWSPRMLHDRAFRAAADVARSLGAPARPAVLVAPTPPADVVFPADMCAQVPKALRERLLGTEGVQTRAGAADPFWEKDAIPGQRAMSCRWRTKTRELTAAITTSSPDLPGADRAVTREYLRRHVAARDQRPVSGNDERSFHALKELGDQGFSAYPGRSRAPGLAADAPARVVVRAGLGLVTVTYGAVPAGEDAEPLAMAEAVNGAYAAAKPVVGFLRH